MEKARLLPLLTIPAMLVIVELAALLLSLPMQSAGITAFEDPESVANPFIFIIILLVFTGFLLLLLRFRWKKLIGAIIGLSIFFTFIYIFAGIAGYFLGLTAITLLISLILSCCLISGCVNSHEKEFIQANSLVESANSIGLKSSPFSTLSNAMSL